MSELRDEDLDQGDEPFETTRVVDGREYPVTVTTDADGNVEVLAQPAVLGSLHEVVSADNESYDKSPAQGLGLAHINAHRHIPQPGRITLPAALGGPQEDAVLIRRRLTRAERRARR